MRTLKIVAAIILATFLGACHKIIQLSSIPYISFTSFTVFDTTDILGNDCKGGRLKFYFQDGDGDLGLDTTVSSGSDTSDLFLTLYRKTNGVMEQVSDNDLMKPSPYRIPYMENTGQDKSLKGTIQVTFYYEFYNIADSSIFKYSFYVKDRAEHVSDTAWTCEIPLSVNNIYTSLK
ncbi:MAG: hypothetical protein ABSG89_03475 [Bacteroidales bacterium]|jgi:hypothetical protein